MRVLVHLCCGPCGITVLQDLLDQGHEAAALFFNPNIQPLAEYMRRRQGALQATARLGIPLFCADELPAREQDWSGFCAFSTPPESGTVPQPGLGSVRPGQAAAGPSGAATSALLAPAQADGLLPPRSVSKNPRTQPPEGPALPADGPAGSAGTLFPESIRDRSLAAQASPEEYSAQDRLRTFPPSLARLPLAMNPALWLDAVAARPQERCRVCWKVRLCFTARFAARRGYDACTSSLLYSRHQDHEGIRLLGEQAAGQEGVLFFYKDYRQFWQEGIRLSREWEIYRQQYCGCLYSEYDRYSRDFFRSLRPEES